MQSTTRFIWTLALAFLLGIVTNGIGAPMWVNIIGVILIVIVMQVISNRMDSSK